MRQDGGDTGPQVAGGERRMPDPDTRYVGDGRMRSDWQLPQGKEIAWPRHRSAYRDWQNLACILPATARRRAYPGPLVSARAPAYIKLG